MIYEIMLMTWLYKLFLASILLMLNWGCIPTEHSQAHAVFHTVDLQEVSSAASERVSPQTLAGIVVLWCLLHLHRDWARECMHTIIYYYCSTYQPGLLALLHSKLMHVQFDFGHMYECIISLHFVILFHSLPWVWICNWAEQVVASNWQGWPTRDGQFRVSLGHYNNHNDMI